MHKSIFGTINGRLNHFCGVALPLNKLHLQLKQENDYQVLLMTHQMDLQSRVQEVMFVAHTIPSMHDHNQPCATTPVRAKVNPQAPLRKPQLSGWKIMRAMGTGSAPQHSPTTTIPTRGLRQETGCLGSAWGCRGQTPSSTNNALVGCLALQSNPQHLPCLLIG